MHTWGWAVLGAFVALAVHGQGLGFEDATSAAGIAFRHAGEVHPEEESFWPAFVEVLGSGACWSDLDGDGLDDLYLVNQQYNLENPGAGPWAGALDPRSQLFLNEGDGTFSDLTEASGAASRAFGMGCSAADWDGDGCEDLFIAALGRSELYRNRCDGSFEDVTATSGVPPGDAGYCRAWPCLAVASAWADYDLDGDLDLYVGTYVNTNLTDTYRSPGWHHAQPNWLLRNRGDGTFEDVALRAGVAGNPTDINGTKTLGVVWTDHDRDGDPDLYVANDGTPNHLFVNHGDGTFHDGAPAAGVDDIRASMGVSARDYDGDGFPDLFMTHHEQQENGFYRNRGDGTFEDRSGEDALHNSYMMVGWGTEFADLDLDGDLDLLVANGHTEWGGSGEGYDQPLQVFRHDPGPSRADATWVDVTEGSGGEVRRVHRGLALADYDLDGDLDVALNPNANQTAALLRSRGAEGHWLAVQLRQPGPNPKGVGAWIEAHAAGRVQWHEVQAGGSYESQHSLTATFGLGAAERVDKLAVHWPLGGTTVLHDLPADRVARVDRSTATWTDDVVSPRTRAALEGPKGGAGWFLGPVAAKVQAHDRGSPRVSGLVATEVAVEGGPWQPHEGALFTFAGDGTHVLRMRSRDAEGNVEPVRTEPVRIDTTPPRVEHRVDAALGSAAWSRGPVTVRLLADDAASGVDHVLVRLDGSAWRPYEHLVRVFGDGVHTLEYTAVDRAGNAAPVASLEVRIDTVAPSAALDRPRAGTVQAGNTVLADLGVGPAVLLLPPDELGLGRGAVRVRADVDDGLSGLARVRFLLGGEVVAERSEAPWEWWWAPPDVSGLHTLAVEAQDHAGNEASREVRVLLVAVAAKASARELPQPLLATDAPRWRP